MIRPVLLAAVLAATLPAVSESATPTAYTLEDYKARVEETASTCEGAPGDSACRVRLESVLSSTVDALSYLGYHGAYDLDADLLRRAFDFPVPEIQVAAVYALARLGPRPGDVPALRATLLSDVPAVRRAAIGTLRLIADDTAQQLVLRAGAMPSGGDFTHQALPFDPAALGIVWPDGARYLHFQAGMPDGTYGFIASESTATIVAAFEATAKTKAVGMGEIEVRFGSVYGDLLAPWVTRNTTLGAVQAIVLSAPERPSETTPVRLAFVYEDYALGSPGFALVSLPAVASPRPAPVTATTLPKPTGDAAEWWSTGNLATHDAAGDAETAAWRAVIDADGQGAAAYLEAFPDGAWHEDAEAMLAAPAIVTDQDVYAETDTVNVSWHGLPAGLSATLVLGREDDDRLLDTQANNAIDVTQGQGEAALTFYSAIEPGVYEVRIVSTDGDLLASTAIRIAMGWVSVQLERTSYKPGEPISAIFKGMGGHPGDMLSIVKKGVDDNEQGTARIETGSATEGAVTLTAPDEPGDYEVRAWYGRDPRLRGRVQFTVRGPDLPPDLAPGAPAIALAGPRFTANERIAVRYSGLNADGYVFVAVPGAPAASYLVYVEAKKPDGLTEVVLPSEPGRYEVRAVVANEIVATAEVTVQAPEGVALAALTLGKTRFVPGEPVIVDFSGMSGARNDYLALAEKGATYRQYETYSYTKGEITGRIELKAPRKPGLYEIRAFFKEDPTVLHGVIDFQVAEPP